MEVLEQCQQSLLPLFSSSSLYTSVPVWMLLCLRSVLSTHPPNCSWLCSCVWLAHFEQCISALGPCEAQKEATPAACSSAPLRRQSVSQLTIPHCYHSSWPLFLLRVPEPPVYPPAKVLHAWGPAGEEPIWLLIRFLYLRLTLLILSAAATQAGGLGLLERERDCVVQYSKHMCVTCMCEVELCTFFRPLARLYKAHFSLHETQNLEWLNMVKEF